MKTSEIPDESRLYIEQYYEEETVRELAKSTKLNYSIVYSYLQKNNLPMKLDRPGKDTKPKPATKSGYFNVHLKKDWMI